MSDDPTNPRPPSGWVERAVRDFDIIEARRVRGRNSRAERAKAETAVKIQRHEEAQLQAEQEIVNQAKATAATKATVAAEKADPTKIPITALQDAEQIQVSAMAKIVHRIRMAQKDPAAFIEFAIRTPMGEEIHLAKFHHEWLAAFESHPLTLIEAPRSHGKTSIVVAYALWRLGRNPNLRIKCVCQNDNKAKERLYEFRMNLETNPAFKLVFPDLKQADVGDWTKTKLYVERTARTRDPSFEAVGIMTAITGGRIDLLLCDDVCDLRNSILYPSMREQVKQKFHGEILGALEPDGQIVYIATPYSTNDLTAVLKVNPEWKYLHYGIGTDDDPMKPLWPEKWTRDLLAERRRQMGSIEFDRAFKCVALSGNTVPCRPDWIRYYTAELIGDPEDMICINGYDLAISKKSSADYFACVTVLFDPKRNLIFVADAYKDRYSFAEQGVRVIEDFKRWNSDKLVIERVGLGGGLESFLTEKAPGLPIYPYYPRGDKQRRFMEVTPLLEEGRIFFHPNLDPARNVLISDRGDLISELLEFPIGRHDDLVDAFVTAIAGLGEYRMPDSSESDWDEGDGTRIRMTVIG
jgi:predicted phage terminase large subunit-like protein